MVRRFSRYSNETGQSITRMIAAARTTQRELAALLGMSYSSFNQQITGRTAARVGLEEDVRRVLRVDGAS